MHPALSANKVAVITGGASGIGLAAAQAFVARGMKVAIADLGEDRLAQARAKIGEDDFHATGDKSLRRSKADARGTAGDDGDAASRKGGMGHFTFL